MHSFYDRFYALGSHVKVEYFEDNHAYTGEYTSVVGEYYQIVVVRAEIGEHGPGKYANYSDD